mgnify:CR=1 FL=1
MGGIQSFVGGGGAFGNRSASRARSSLARNTRYTPPSKDDSNQNRSYQSPSSSKTLDKPSDEKSFFQKSAEKQITGKDFVSDLKKASQFLYTQNPMAQQLMAKYGLDEGDLIKLRIGVTQPGFAKNIRDVGSKAVNFMLAGSPQNFNINQALSMYTPDMDPMNRTPSSRSGILGFLENQFQSSPFSLMANAFAGGSPQAVAGMDYLNRQRDAQGNRLFTQEQANQLGAVSANVPSVYEQLTLTPEFAQRGIDSFSYDTQRRLNEGKNMVRKQEAAAADPITFAYNPNKNPYGNFGINSYFV